MYTNQFSPCCRVPVALSLTAAPFRSAQPAQRSAWAATYRRHTGSWCCQCAAPAWRGPRSGCPWRCGGRPSSDPRPPGQPLRRAVHVKQAATPGGRSNNYSYRPAPQPQTSADIELTLVYKYRLIYFITHTVNGFIKKRKEIIKQPRLF